MFWIKDVCLFLCVTVCLHIFHIGKKIWHVCFTIWELNPIQNKLDQIGSDFPVIKCNTHVSQAF